MFNIGAFVSLAMQSIGLLIEGPHNFFLPSDFANGPTHRLTGRVTPAKVSSYLVASSLEPERILQKRSK